MARVYQNRNGQLIPVTPDTSIENTVDDLSSRVDQLHISGSYTLPPATTSTLGGAMPDGQTITVDADGTIHVDAGDPLVPSDAAPEPLGDAAAMGTSTEYSRADHAHQKEDVPMFSGDAATMTISADTRLTADGPRRLAVTSTTVDCKLMLPSGDAMSDEGIAFIITNAGQYDIIVTTLGGMPIGTETDGGKLAPGKMRFYLLVDPDNGMWACDEWAGNAVVNKETKKYEGMTAGTPITFNDSTFVCTKYWAKLDEDRVVVVWRSSSSSTSLYASVLSISGTSITVGTQVTVSASAPCYIQEISGDRVVVLWSGALCASILLINGMSITVGSRASLYEWSDSYHYYIHEVSGDRLVVFWRGSSTDDYALYAAVLSISGTSITAGTKYKFSSASSLYHVQEFSVDRIVVVYLNTTGISSSYLLVAVVLSISGTIITAGTQKIVETGSFPPICMQKLSDDRVALFYGSQKGSSSYYTYFVSVLSIMGTRITTDIQKFLLISSAYRDSCYIQRLSGDRFVFFWISAASSYYYIYVNTLSISGVSATIGSYSNITSIPSPLSRSAPYYFIHELSGDRVVVVWRSSSSPTSLYASVLSISGTSITVGTQVTVAENLKDVIINRSCPSWIYHWSMLGGIINLRDSDKVLASYRGGLTNQYQGSVTLVSVDENGTIDPAKCQTLDVTELTGTNPGEIGSTNLIQVGDTVLFMTEAKYRGNKLEIIPISFSS